ncbi:transmembrane and TPR repeat-containing protein 4-like [Elysia marginata]|uniref:Transmembrane and TPR repeat-containing protein 4-like n=1 Tax=Elysia marginata TaxID=1093978 RepID=A0AAV4ET86_9GAST|nr:transmembrane and TPR repeat-containing protein 4-like [Elysia marginata]
MTFSNSHRRNLRDTEYSLCDEKEKLRANDISKLTAGVAVFGAAVLCFVNSYDGDFVFDDSEAIVNNNDLLPSTPLLSIFQHDFWGKKLGNHSHKSYRPLTVLTFR